MEDRKSNDVFVLVGIAEGYAWNNAPIDVTDILRSTITIDRDIRFPIGIKLSALPQLTQNNAQSTIDYLRLTISTRPTMLKLLIEDRRTTHIEWIHNNKILSN